MLIRDYQQKAIEDIYAAWNSGARNVCLQLPTGAGKTFIFTHIIAHLKIPSIAIAHRSELVSQISLALARANVPHGVIAQKATVKEIISLHHYVIGKNYVNPTSRVVVASVDTLLRLNPTPAWFNQIKLVIQDEGHHALRDNKWGRAASLFPNARGLYPTATPCRADGKGLGSHADGLIDALVLGPTMRSLIDQGHLSNYTVFSPPSDLNLANVSITAGGDYNPKQLRFATHKSHIVGDIILHYKRIASHKLGITYAVDVAAAEEIAQQFKANDIPAEVITSKTPALLRARIMERFRKREFLQLVNVDLLGEGVDVPAIEVVSMARATQSYALFAQQFGRALRPMAGKDKAVIIDHVGNTLRHGLPDDLRRVWTLDRRDSKSRTSDEQITPTRTCLNSSCFAVYERIYKACPYCGYYAAPAERSRPEQVDGDLVELSQEALDKLRGEITRIDGEPRIPQHLERPAQYALIRRHNERQEAQVILRAAIAQWAGFFREQGLDDSEIYRRFYFTFKIDILSAQTLNAKSAEELAEKITQDCIRLANDRFRSLGGKVEDSAGSNNRFTQNATQSDD